MRGVQYEPQRSGIREMKFCLLAQSRTCYLAALLARWTLYILSVLWINSFALPWLVPSELLGDRQCCLLLQTMAMVESIWPSEQLAMALTTPVDPSNLDSADPQVRHRPSLTHESLIHSRERDQKQIMSAGTPGSSGHHTPSVLGHCPSYVPYRTARVAC